MVLAFPHVNFGSFRTAANNYKEIKTLGAFSYTLLFTRLNAVIVGMAEISRGN